MRDNQWTWVALAGLALAGLVLFLNAQFPSVLQAEGAQMRLVYAVTLLVVVGGSVVLGWRERAGVALKQAVAWIAIALVLVIGYSYRDSFGGLGARAVSELTPTRPAEEAPGVVSLGSDLSGHFVADANVNGTHVRFLVDTGASDVALTASDARRIGIDIDELRYIVPYQTANGVAYGARVRVDEISIGSITLYNVAGSVVPDGLAQSLLGMSFLNQLSSMEVADGRLMLRQ